MVELTPDNHRNLLQVLEVTRWLHQDLAEKVHPVVCHGVPAKAQMCQVLVAHECKRKKATAGDIQVAFV